MSELKILIVDDTALSRMGTVVTLQNLGFKTDEAANGREALARIEDCLYRMILMDYNMPDMDGFECTQKIREFEKGTGTRIPIIGLTSSDEVQIREKCLQAGMDDYLQKTCTKEELLHVVAKWLM